MKDLLAILCIVILGAGLYALTLRGVPGNPQPRDFQEAVIGATMPFELSPERGRYTHLLALANDHTYALSPELATIAAPDVGVYRGRFFSFFAPGIPYLALPFYQIGARFDLAQVGSFSLISIASVLALIVLYKIARNILRLPIWASLAAVMVFAFGSTAWSYAISLYQHHLTALFMLASFYAVWKYRERTANGWLWACLAWASYALAIFIDYPNALLLLPVMAYLVASSIRITNLREKIKVSLRLTVIATALAFAAITGLHFLHNATYFGSWSTISSSIPTYRPASAETTDGRNAAATVGGQKSIARFFDEESLPKGFHVLLFSDERGLFYYAPVFLIALIGIYLMVRTSLNLETGTILALIATNVFLYSSWGDPWGGWAFGPRYLIPSMALLALCVSYALVSAKRSLMLRSATFVLFIFSSAISLLGALTTSGVPPKSEAVGLDNLFTYTLNLRYFNLGMSSSYVYNTFIAHSISLPVYYLALLTIVILSMAMVLFIIPRGRNVS